MKKMKKKLQCSLIYITNLNEKRLLIVLAHKRHLLSSISTKHMAKVT